MLNLLVFHFFLRVILFGFHDMNLLRILTYPFTPERSSSILLLMLTFLIAYLVLSLLAPSSSHLFRVDSVTFVCPLPAYLHIHHSGEIFVSPARNAKIIVKLSDLRISCRVSLEIS